MIASQSTSKSPRRGSVAHEVTMAVVLAVSVMLGVAQISAFVSQQRRILQHQTIAQRAAGNIMEQLIVRPWNELTPETAAALQLSQQTKSRLPGARLQVRIDDDESDGKRVTVEIDVSFGEHRAAPTRIVAWKYPPATEAAK